MPGFLEQDGESLACFYPYPDIQYKSWICRFRSELNRFIDRPGVPGSNNTLTFQTFNTQKSAKGIYNSLMRLFLFL